MGNYNWIHCYQCFCVFSAAQNVKFYLTGCCMFQCEACSQKSANRCCCGGSCKKMALSNKMQKDVQILLEDPIDHLKQLIKNVDFQGKHRFHLFRYKHQNLTEIKSEINQINSKILSIQSELQSKLNMYNIMKSQILKLKETVNTLTTSRPGSSNAFQEEVFNAKSPLEQVLSSPNNSRGSHAHHQITNPPTSKFYYKTPASWNPGTGRPNCKSGKSATINGIIWNVAERQTKHCIKHTKWSSNSKSSETGRSITGKK